MSRTPPDRRCECRREQLAPEQEALRPTQPLEMSGGVLLIHFLFPTRQEGVVRFYVGIRVCDASTPPPHPVSCKSSSPVDPAEYSARAARQWIPPSIRQSCSPVDPAQSCSPVARQWIPPSIPPERLASGSRQSSSPVDPAKYPTRAARQWIPPSILLSIPK